MNKQTHPDAKAEISKLQVEQQELSALRQENCVRLAEIKILLVGVPAASQKPDHLSLFRERARLTHENLKLETDIRDIKHELAALTPAVRSGGDHLHPITHLVAARIASGDKRELRALIADAMDDFAVISAVVMGAGQSA
jgi:hypothetical protein